MRDDAIAIVGAAGRFPGAADIEGLWQAVMDGRDLVSDLSEDELIQSGASREEIKHAEFVRRGAFLENSHQFDASFFRTLPHEALLTDPQQRLFLEICYRALEDAGCLGQDSGSVGVFAGTRESDWHELIKDVPKQGSLDEYLIINGNASDSVASRVAYKLGLGGPALSVRTACSGSLVAVHLACQHLRSKQCDVAVAGGASVHFPARRGYWHRKGGITSKTGRCYSFDERADGTIFSDSVGAVVLRRLSDAIAAGDNILAVILGSAINNDGNDRAGFAAPSAKGQARVICAALDDAGIGPEQVTLIEAHGTGTPVGDVIEFRALKEVFGNCSARIALGSIKSNLGHADCAAGIVGLLKAVWAIKEGMVPPSPYVVRPNPSIPADDETFFFPSGAVPWNGSRIAGISSFGIGGTNAHVVVGQPPEINTESTRQDWHLIPLSARTPEQLKKYCAVLASFLSQPQANDIADIAYTLQRGRPQYGQRRVVLARDYGDLLIGLAATDAVAVPGGAIADRRLVDAAEKWCSLSETSLPQLYSEEIRRKVSLPGIPLSPIDLLPPQHALMTALNSTEDEPMQKLKQQQSTDMLEKITTHVSRILDVSLTVDDRDVLLVELGADSLLMFDAVEALKSTYGVELTVRQLFSELSTIAKLTDFILLNEPKQFPPNVLTKLPSMPIPATIGSQAENAQEASVLEVMRNQLALMKRQLDILNLTGDAPDQPAAPAPPRMPVPPTSSPHSLIKSEGSAQDLLVKRRNYLNEFVPAYSARTAKSKEHGAKVRDLISDSRSGIGFRHSLKELVYPIVSNEMNGSRLRDIDDNEYVDMTMGFGVHLFGHNPSSITEGLVNQINKGFGLGLRNSVAVELAEKLKRLTGMTRFAFVTSGTEAVMNAVRTARAHTGKRKIAIFSSSYHGHWDAVLATSAQSGVVGDARPLAAGIPPSMIADVAILEFGTDDAIAYIRENRSELAAVMIEPIPARDPRLCSREFLQSLAEVTKGNGILLIFDEMVTGFRCHPGGVQALFEVEADIVTYGKIIGGGLPIGIIAGRGATLDPIDGGVWNFGDESFPAADPTFFGGTFFQHPLTLTAATKVASILISEGPSLLRRLSERTEAFVARLNRMFDEIQVAVSASCFGSMFRLHHKENLDLLYYNLIHRGVYIWEWRCWFLSTAHKDEDLDLVFDAIRESLLELKGAGLA
ncbi:aminotransferase class III-fold pyridoxal phosphate-dependent enzyme [Rhizobium changzhiense]|uniref:aminotransferase class III-fold pyridoxal phosphate-dependent enzyme n=1 Tax=Rhizobium changzhiense TaxID=2692317 RepID=UPI001F0C70BD|nr:aminotransferase class III-fold pyridoxal phosphate-dependent enzyme [Rhizobium changzhiense]MCH4547471.1 aminotransferase class III-fold pyridoxal phosphate-dependent enzyme [Rhizobium changzhiense]